jgi:hypothetical protein
VCHCSDVVHAEDLGLRCCGNSATIVTASDGVDMFGCACYIITRLGLQRLDLASRCSTNVYCDKAELGNDESTLHAPSMQARVVMDGSDNSISFLPTNMLL